jgi:hypothetical protein
MKKMLMLLSLILLFSCADYSERIKTIEKKYPKCIVLPSLPNRENRQSHYSYDVIVKDTINKQMYGISFYPFSETKISQIDLILYYNL